MTDAFVGFLTLLGDVTSLQARWGAILPINEPLFRERFANQLAPYPLRTDGKRGTIGADLKGIPGMIDRTGFIRIERQGVGCLSLRGFVVGTPG